MYIYIYECIYIYIYISHTHMYIYIFSCQICKGCLEAWAKSCEWRIDCDEMDWCCASTCHFWLHLAAMQPSEASEEVAWKKGAQFAECSASTVGIFCSEICLAQMWKLLEGCQGMLRKPGQELQMAKRDSCSNFPSKRSCRSLVPSHSVSLFRVEVLYRVGGTYITVPFLYLWPDYDVIHQPHCCWSEGTVCFAACHHRRPKLSLLHFFHILASPGVVCTF